MGSTKTVGVLLEVAAERENQERTWGVQNHPDGTGNHIWELDTQELKARFEAGERSWALILGEEVAEAFDEVAVGPLREELVQVAAVAVAWIEALDRRVAEAHPTLWEKRSFTDEAVGACGAVRTPMPHGYSKARTCERPIGHAGVHADHEAEWSQS